MVLKVAEVYEGFTDGRLTLPSTWSDTLKSAFEDRVGPLRARAMLLQKVLIEAGGLIDPTAEGKFIAGLKDKDAGREIMRKIRDLRAWPSEIDSLFKKANQNFHGLFDVIEMGNCKTMEEVDKAVEEAQKPILGARRAGATPFALSPRQKDFSLTISPCPRRSLPWKTYRRTACQ